MWKLSEQTTGLGTVEGRTQKETIAYFSRLLRENHITKKQMTKIIKMQIQKYGRAPKSQKKGYFYITVRGGTTLQPLPHHKLVKGKPVVIPGWEEFKFFLYKNT